MDVNTRIEENELNRFGKQAFIAEDIAAALLDATIPNQVYNSVIKHTYLNNGGTRAVSHIPLYHRAFPTHEYETVTYWHSYYGMITISLLLYFCLPAAVLTHSYSLTLTHSLLLTHSLTHSLTLTHLLTHSLRLQPDPSGER